MAPQRDEAFKQKGNYCVQHTILQKFTIFHAIRSWSFQNICNETRWPRFFGPPCISLIYIYTAPVLLADYVTTGNGLKKWRQLRPIISEINTAIRQLRPIISQITTAIRQLRPIISEITTAIRQLRPIISEITTAIRPLRPIISQITTAIRPLRPIISEITTAIRQLRPIISQITTAIRSRTSNST